jgi:hypothetical protein
LIGIGYFIKILNSIDKFFQKWPTMNFEQTIERRAGADFQSTPVRKKVRSKGTFVNPSRLVMALKIGDLLKLIGQFHDKSFKD